MSPIKPISSLFIRNQPPNKVVVTVVTVLAVISFGLALFGEALWTRLVSSNPAILIALNPTNKNLLLVNGDQYGIEAFPYFSIGFARLLSSDPLYFLLGFWYGEKALNWIQKRNKSFAQLAEEGEDFMLKFSYIFVFFAPVSYICVLAGAVGMKVKTFFALNVLGTIFSLVVIRWVGFQFGGGIDRFIDFLGRYKWQALGLSIAYVAWTLFKGSRSGKSDLSIIKDISSDK